MGNLERCRAPDEIYNEYISIEWSSYMWSVEICACERNRLPGVEGIAGTMGEVDSSYVLLELLVTSMRYLKLDEIEGM